jgi:hypothetical protein
VVSPDDKNGVRGFKTTVLPENEAFAVVNRSFGTLHPVMEKIGQRLKASELAAEPRFTTPRPNSATAARLGAAVDGHESFKLLAADELFLALVELDLGLRLGCLVRRGHEADPLGLELGLAPLALPLLTLVLRPAHAVPPFACARTR